MSPYQSAGDELPNARSRVVSIAIRMGDRAAPPALSGESGDCCPRVSGWAPRCARCLPPTRGLRTGSSSGASIRGRLRARRSQRFMRAAENLELGGVGGGYRAGPSGPAAAPHACPTSQGQQCRPFRRDGILQTGAAMTGWWNDGLIGCYRE